MLIVVAGTSFGIPAPIATWRAGFCPSPAVRTQPSTTSSTSSAANTDPLQRGAHSVRAELRRRDVLELPAEAPHRRPHGADDHSRSPSQPPRPGATLGCVGDTQHTPAASLPAQRDPDHRSSNSLTNLAGRCMVVVRSAQTLGGRVVPAPALGRQWWLTQAVSANRPASRSRACPSPHRTGQPVRARERCGPPRELAQSRDHPPRLAGGTA